MKPLAIDLFCGLGGWAEGFLSEDYRVVGFDNGDAGIDLRGYPSQLVLQDVLTLHGSQFKDATIIVASPPCQAYSYRAMPWKRAKALGPPDNTLFDACFRIQREASEAAGHKIPLIVENVKSAQKWVGRAKWHYGSMYFWGDVPALMPIGRHKKQQLDGSWFYNNYEKSARRFSSGSKERKQWSAEIAKIPIEVATWIARCYYPSGVIKQNEASNAASVAMREVVGVELGMPSHVFFGPMPSRDEASRQGTLMAPFFLKANCYLCHVRHGD